MKQNQQQDKPLRRHEVHVCARVCTCVHVCTSRLWASLKSDPEFGGECCSGRSWCWKPPKQQVCAGRETGIPVKTAPASKSTLVDWNHFQRETWGGCSLEVDAGLDSSLQAGLMSKRRETRWASSVLWTSVLGDISPGPTAMANRRLQRWTGGGGNICWM